MPSAYLALGDYAAYAPGATGAQVQQASAIIDAAVGRPEGLTWVAGADGLPCYMAGADPIFSFPLPGALAPGANVQIAVPAALCRPERLGEVVILDRADTSKTEAATISAVGTASLTLDKLAFAHSQGSSLEFGLVVTEEHPLPAKRNIMRVLRTPVARVFSAVGRYSMGRRSQSAGGMMQDFNLLASVQAFGGPPTWNLMDASLISASLSTGELWLPTGFYGSTWQEAKVGFVCGWPSTQIPAQVKGACGKLVAQLQQFPEISGNVRLFKAGDTEVQRFTDSVLDAETKAYLDPFRLRAFV